MTYTEPFEDPRHLIALLGETLQFAIVAPRPANYPNLWRDLELDALQTMRALCTFFQKAPSDILRGGARSKYRSLRDKFINPDGTPSRYCQTHLMGVDNDYRAPAGVRNRLTCLNTLLVWPRAAMETALMRGCDVMRLPASQRLAWPSHLQALAALAPDHRAVAREAFWRFRDFTARQHRGSSTRDAFEALWLAQQYDGAKQLLTV